MKRNVNIIPLSREHHYGLLFCWKIRQGLAKQVSLDRIRLYILHFWKDNLKGHFQVEETLLFKGQFGTLCTRALEEHKEIRGLIGVITGSGFRAESYYARLANTIEKHIRFEEREVFPFLEKQLTEERLTTVGALLSSLHDKPADDIYADEFWT